MESSKQQMIDTVIAHKERIVITTNEILEKLSELQKSYLSGKETSLYLRKQVNRVVSDLSIIGGFCGKRERNLIELTNHLAQLILRAKDKIGFVGLMKDWCIEVNGIIVDFNKIPFRFVGGEFKVSLRNLEGKIKAILKR